MTDDNEFYKYLFVLFLLFQKPPPRRLQPLSDEVRKALQEHEWPVKEEEDGE